MKVFVTGGTGFIGKRVVKKLVERGDKVYTLVRSRESAALALALGAHPVWGDISAIESMRAGMQGSDAVYHIAGWYKLGSEDWKKAKAINIDGTRNVLGLAHELGVPKIIYTSTVAVHGDTRGVIADENYPQPQLPSLTEYDRTKMIAHYQIAEAMIKAGAPITIVMPGVVFGPGDPSLFGEMMRLFYKGFLPVLPGPELKLTFVYVDDIAEGHILAAEKGKPGESYILTGPILSMAEVVNIWAQVSGKRGPYFNIPARFIKPLAPVAEQLQKLPGLPNIISRDAVAILEATYIASANKARTELGWIPRPLEESIHETFAWIASQEPDAWSPSFKLSETQRRQVAAIAIGAAIGLVAAWMLTRRKK